MWMSKKLKLKGLLKPISITNLAKIMHFKKVKKYFVQNSDEKERSWYHVTGTQRMGLWEDF